MPSESLSPGDFYGDRRILGLLGRGGMGAVYRVEHPRLLPRERALKVLHPGVWLPPRWEVNAASRLGHHPNVVQTLGAGHDRATGTYFHEMELLEGSTLELLVHPGAPLAPSVVFAMLEGVAAALDAAHRQQLVHCDLKPANLLLSKREGVVKVLDFGIAEALWEPGYESGRGTLLYMAREQLLIEPVLPQTDLWAFGLVAHFLLTSTRYWRERQPDRLRAEILAGPSESPSLLLDEAGVPPSVSEAYAGWLRRCLAALPARRFGDAREALKALRGALEHADLVLERPLIGAGRSGAAAQPEPHADTTVLPRRGDAGGAPASTRALLAPAPNQEPAAPVSPGLTLAESQELLVRELFPRASDLLRVADDLSSTSAHYLIRPPSDRASFSKQLQWFSVGVNAYHEARACYDRERERFARLLDVSFGQFDDALHAAARDVHALSNGFQAIDPLPTVAADPDVRAQHAALCAEWQGTRMTIGSLVRQSRRALDKLEALVEEQASSGAMALPPDAEAAARALRLLRSYGERAHGLADRISERLLTADLSSAREVTDRLWEIAPAISAVNQAFVELSAHSLWLRVLLLQRSGPDWRAEHKLASALQGVIRFQWELFAPRLNGVLVAAISFLLGDPDPRWLAPLRAQLPEWNELVRTLRSVEMPAPFGTGSESFGAAQRSGIPLSMNSSAHDVDRVG